MISITPIAAQMIGELLNSDEALADFGLRVGVRLAGCSGMSYAVEFTPEPEEGDLVSEVQGVKIFMSPIAAPYLEGAELDFETGSKGAGFRFNQPNKTDNTVPVDDESFLV